MDHFNSDTICALATPPGQGAIAVIRLSGEEALDIGNEVFRPKKKSGKLQDFKGYTIHFGTIVRDEEIVDEVLVSLFRKPNSYTGEDLLEISCHGSEYIQQKVIELLIEKGARHAEPGEFTLRAFMNGKFDLSQAEAVADLIASSSKRSHDLAMDQMRGGFSNRIKDLRKRLLDFTSLIELELDFSEEDVEFANRDQLVNLLEEMKKEIGGLVSSFSIGNVLKRGIPVAIIGEPNVGKSTLLNAILNEERAIVSEIPGTTRDTIEDTIILSNYIFRFIDTAGLRHSSDQVETIGIERTYEKIRQAKIVLYVFDVGEVDCEEVKMKLEEFASQQAAVGNRQPQDSELPEHPNIYPPERSAGGPEHPNGGEAERQKGGGSLNKKKFILVANKMDQLMEAPKHLKEFLEMECLFVSAKRKENINLITDSLVEAVKELDISDTTLVSNIRHYEALAKSKEAVESVIKGLEENIPSDLLTVDIRTALHHLGEITGEITTDEILGNIFSKFCIGK